MSLSTVYLLSLPSIFSLYTLSFLHHQQPPPPPTVTTSPSTLTATATCYMHQ
ncbi:hypothetical protein HanPSC8_Chr12g0512381 [Helianthus annuus]|nr:hypothetical protein HanPSC8_Chr12g0512381 [Helianthus annuus]